ncbi:MAG TPA: hypothetical protein VI172_13715 [Candidatus Dormibacteraeota bacterium]
MPKKKPKPKLQLHPRFTAAEMEAIEADRKTLPAAPSGSAYAKYAVLSYPKLRKLEELVRRDAAQPDWSKQASSRELLAEAGL